MEEIKTRDDKLLIGELFATDLVKEFGNPLYAYDAEIIRKKISEFKSCILYPKFSIHYAMKANPNFSILKLMEKERINIDAVSVNEIKLALKAGFSPERILFTGNYVSMEDMDYVKQSSVSINIDSLSMLEKFGDKYPGSKVCVRINPNVKATTHSHLATASDDKKFGITFRQIDDIKRIAKDKNLIINGIHGHLGTNIFVAEEFLSLMDIILDSAKHFEDLEFVDFGGGYGVSYEPSKENIDLVSFGKAASERFEKFCNTYGKKLELKFEPGRFLVCEAGYLLANINTIKRRKLDSGTKIFYGIDTNMAHLARPAMYDSYHHIINASKIKGEQEEVDVVGNICESGDFLGTDRKIVKAQEGDTIAIMNAGAYGFSMSSNYNFFEKPAEVLVDGNKAKLITKRQKFDSIINDMVLE